MDQTLYLGIDGGGSTCRARLADADGRVLGEGRAGAANTLLGVENAFVEIETATRAALSDAGLPLETMGRLHAGLGLAGLSLERDLRSVRAHVHPFATATVRSDAHIACLGAFAGADGAILIVGTGTCGCAILQGRETTVGGWGFAVGDQGSGAALGRAAVRRAILAHDGVIPATALTAAVMAGFGDSPEQAVLWAQTAKPKDYAAFAPEVIETAASGDVVAREILQHAVKELSRFVRALIGRGAPKVALVGGLAGPIAPWLPDDISAFLTKPLGDALDGALLLARRHAGAAAEVRT